MSLSNIDSRSFVLDRALTFRIEDDPDGGFVAQCLEVPGAISQGETPDEAFRNVVSATGDVLEVGKL